MGVCPGRTRNYGVDCIVISLGSDGGIWCGRYSTSRGNDSGRKRAAVEEGLEWVRSIIVGGKYDVAEDKVFRRNGSVELLGQPL